MLRSSHRNMEVNEGLEYPKLISLVVVDDIVQALLRSSHRNMEVNNKIYHVFMIKQINLKQE